VSAPPKPLGLRGRRGAVAHAAGAAAEEGVARHYEARGLVVAARRWRAPGGEVDLILRDGALLVFVEVKRAATLEAAAHRLSRRQANRLLASAQAFCAGEPRGLLADMRFDLALVDALGRVRVIENAFGEDF
jgi:putative endonuclease